MHPFFHGVLSSILLQKGCLLYTSGTEVCFRFSFSQSRTRFHFLFRPFKGQHLPLSTTSSDNEPCEQARVMHPSTDLAVAEPFQFSLRTLPSDSGSDDPTISSPTSQRYNWKIWARWEPGPRHKIFHCLWPSQDGKRQYCGYSSKKQLVKRHIEGTHLRLK